MSHSLRPLQCAVGLQRRRVDTGQERSKRQSHILVRAKLRQCMCILYVYIACIVYWMGIIAAQAAGCQFLRQLRRRLAIAIHRPIGQSLQLTTSSLIGSSRMSTQLKKRLLWHDFWIWHRGAGAAYVCKPHSARPTMTHDRRRR